MDDERYISVEQSILDACREVREMRAGRLPERSLEDFFIELKQLIEDESKLPEEENIHANSDNRKIRARR